MYCGPHMMTGRPISGKHVTNGKGHMKIKSDGSECLSFARYTAWKFRIRPTFLSMQVCHFSREFIVWIFVCWFPVFKAPMTVDREIFSTNHQSSSMLLQTREWIKLADSFSIRTNNTDQIDKFVLVPRILYVGRFNDQWTRYWDLLWNPESQAITANRRHITNTHITVSMMMHIA